VEHAHKEIVPTEHVKEGNFDPKAPVVKLNDECNASGCPKEIHIPTKPGGKK
jgi:hypothetical protein